MKAIRLIITTAILLFNGSILVVPVAAAPVDVFDPCKTATSNEICKAARGRDPLFGPGGTWNRILNVMTFVIGAISILMIILGGIRYTLSGGDQAGVSSAKNTILYSVIGLVVAVMANAIVNFVLTNV